MRPKFLTKRLLGALGPPLLHQGLPKGPRASKNDRFRPQNDHEIQEKSNTKEKKQTRHNDNDKKFAGPTAQWRVRTSAMTND